MLSDRYTLGEVIGSGGMSEVYAGEDISLGRSVAIKMLRPEMARDVNFRERFRREAQNSDKLKHPNIVATYDTGEATIDGIDIPYIVMERVYGRTLRDILREEGPMSPEEATATLKPVADALQASHEAGIIHRDIKPANIMITNTGQVKVMDFGIARALDDSTSAMTQTSAVIGTAQYLSPEQARGKTADARSDVYALGCVLYETVAGCTPFEGETPFAVAYQHVQEDPEPPSVHIPDLSPTQKVNVDAVVLTAMAKHPADRYQSAWEMGDDLDRLAHGQVTEAARAHMVPPAADENPTTTIDRAPVASTRPVAQEDATANRLKWMAALLAVTLVAVVGYFGWDFYQNSQALKAQEEQRQAQAANMVIIPEVENRPRAEVQKELEDLGLLVQVNQEPNADVARDNAIRINPAAGSQLQKNSTVILTVSSGKEITDVPDVSGMSVEDATKTLSAAGLQIDENIEEVDDQNVDEGKIVSQQPTGGSQMSKGSKVKVKVSKGQAITKVAKVEGLDLNSAKSTLEAQGFTVNISMVDSDQPEGRVLEVSNSGSDLKKGDTVTLEVSNGMLITAPALVRKSQADAQRALSALGWTGSFTISGSDDTPVPTDVGLISWSAVSEGQQIRKDQNIEIHKWKLVDVGAQLGNAFNGIGGR